MASDLHKKSKQSDGTETPSITEQKQVDNVAFNSFLFTPEQRQILGNVYKWILGRRRERLTKVNQPVIPASPVPLSAEREV